MAIAPCGEDLGRLRPAWRRRADEALSFFALADALVDLWDVNVSAVAEPWRDMAPSRLSPAGWQLEWASRVREATERPIVGVGRLTNPDQMADILRSGTLDIIGVARPLIADPFLPRKIESGHYDDIRERIGCNICLTRALGTGPDRLHSERDGRGGVPPELASRALRASCATPTGPCSSSAAEWPAWSARSCWASVATQRVHLAERASSSADTRPAASLPHLGEWRRLVDWRVVQLNSLATSRC